MHSSHQTLIIERGTIVWDNHSSFFREEQMDLFVVMAPLIEDSGGRKAVELCGR